MAAVVEAGHAASKQKTEAHQTKQEFLAVFEKLRDELLEDSILAGQPESSKDWLRKMLDYNVPHGKLNRGMAVLDVLLAARGGDVTEKEREAANVLGWCIELLQAYFLVADDIMDSSLTRRGQPCWYRQPHVGMVAINDGIILESCIYRLLKLHFRAHPAYVHLLELFHDTTHRTAHGQLLDTTTAPPGGVDLARYTEATYLRIVTYKTAFYTIYLPVACGLALAGVTDEASLALAEDLSVRMGCYFQIQDDVLDAFGEPEVIGKVGTDIQDSKCSWLVVRALAVASAEQREAIKANYGRDDAEAVEAVKAVYRELDLPAAFAAYEQESYDGLVQAIEGQDKFPPAVFMGILAKIYKRTK
ncbi:FPS1 [Auxenochlorella protothecoides x Auxenochlorella symbiontica]